MVRAVRAGRQALSGIPSCAQRRWRVDRGAGAGLGFADTRSGGERRAGSRRERLAAARSGPAVARALCAGLPRCQPGPHHPAVSRRHGPYLQPAGGPPSFDVRRVVRPELLVEILPAIRETDTTGVSSRRGLRLGDGREVSIEVIALAGSAGARSFLILFDDGSRPATSGRLPAAGTSTLPESEKDDASPNCTARSRACATTCGPRSKSTDHRGGAQIRARGGAIGQRGVSEHERGARDLERGTAVDQQGADDHHRGTADRNQELLPSMRSWTARGWASDRARSYADIIIETVREPLAVLDGAQRILRVNSAFSVSLEVPREDAEGRLLHDIDDGRWNIPELQQRLAAILTGGQPLEDWEVTVDLTRHGRRTISLSARRIPGDADRTELLLVAFEDTTARTNLTAGLLADGERKDQFIAMLGHELRHPLTPIAHAIYLLKRRQSGSDGGRTPSGDRYRGTKTVAVRERTAGCGAHRPGPRGDSAGAARFRRTGRVQPLTRSSRSSRSDSTRFRWWFLRRRSTSMGIRAA